MSDKLLISICTGTLCYVMGGAELPLLDDHLTEEEREKVEIKGVPCLDCCNHSDSPKAPFVLVGEQLLSEATIIKVVSEIREQLKSKEA